jgi:hypothetical protein
MNNCVMAVAYHALTTMVNRYCSSQPARGRWLCCQSTGKWSDAVALHLGRHNSPLEEAVRALCCGCLPHTPAPAWQNRARDVIAEAQRQLWAKPPGAAEVRCWLDRRRGLSRSLLKLWQIGWLPQPLREPAEWWGLPAGDEPVYIAAGVLLPCVVDHAIWYLKVRRLEREADPKYVHVRGSCPALYLADTITAATRIVALTEGEFDALVLWQSLRARRWPQPIGVATFGSATNRLREPWVGRLKGRKLLTLYDRDEAGEAATAWWAAHVPGAVAVAIPPLGPGIKDVTDYWRAGGRPTDLLISVM